MPASFFSTIVNLEDMHLFQMKQIQDKDDRANQKYAHLTLSSVTKIKVAILKWGAVKKQNKKQNRF